MKLEPLTDVSGLRGHLAVADRYLTGEPDAPPLPSILGFLGHHPGIAQHWLGLSGVLLEDPLLDARDRELLILRVADRTACEYVRAQHARIGREAGLTDDEVEGTADWSPADRDLLDAADQMVERHAVDDATWQRLAERFDEQELVELLFVVGSYLCLAVVLNSVGLEA